MTYELSGELYEMGNTEKVSERFQKREFVVKQEEQNGEQTFTDFIKFQLTQNRCDLIEGYKPGDQVKVAFRIKGNRWERDGKVNYFTNLDAWRIEKTSQGTPDMPPMPQQEEEPFYPDDQSGDELPF